MLEKFSGKLKKSAPVSKEEEPEFVCSLHSLKNWYLFCLFDEFIHSFI